MAGMWCGGKDKWPELVGMDGKEAAAIITRENPCVGAYVVQSGVNGVTADYRRDRVWVWVDEHGRVQYVPHIG